MQFKQFVMLGLHVGIGAAVVHEKSEPQVSWRYSVGQLWAKRKLEVGFHGRLFFVSPMFAE